MIVIFAKTWLKRYEKQSKKDFKYYIIKDAPITEVRVKKAAHSLTLIEKHLTDY